MLWRQHVAVPRNAAVCYLDVVLPRLEWSQRIDQTDVVMRRPQQPAHEIGGVQHVAILEQERVAAQIRRSEMQRRDAVGRRVPLVDEHATTVRDMAHHGVERVRVLHLDSKNRLIRDELMSEGTIDEAALYAREVIRRAIDLKSSAIILVHNHPSGDASPSRADIDVTRAIADAGRRLGIALHDHIIIAAGGHTSLRAQGLI